MTDILRAWVGRSFRNRIFVAMLAATLLPLLVCGGLMLNLQVVRSQESLAQESHAQLAALGAALDDFRDACRDIARTLTDSTVVRSALRRAGDRTPAPSRGVLTMGPLTVDPARHVVQAGACGVTLTLKEFQLLVLLLEHPGAVFTRDQLLSTIWGYDFDGASRTVDVHIRTLRQKLGEAGNLIQTVRGMGYKIEEAP